MRISYTLELLKSTLSPKGFKSIFLSLSFILVVSMMSQAQDALDENHSILELSHESIDDSRTKITYHRVHDTDQNPYELNYEYWIEKSDAGYSIESKTLLSDLDIRLDEGLEFSYAGNMLFFPKKINIGDRLSEITGTLTVQGLEEGIDLKYELSTTKRNVQSVETLQINGETLKSYVIVTKLEVNRISNGELVNSTDETLKDWYVAGIGTVKRERHGVMQVMGETFPITTSAQQVLEIK